MVKEILLDLFYFILLFFLSLVVISLLIKFIMDNNLTMGTIFEADDGTADRESTFAEIVRDTYLLAIGLSSNGEIGYGLVIFMVGSLMFIVVLLNLLIAVVGDTFDKVQENRVPQSYIEQCALMLDVEQLLYMFNKDSGKEKYIHMVQYTQQVE